MDKFENHLNKTLDGRYQIKNVVGVGGMAYVLCADDLLMNRRVAVKILSDEYNGDEQAVKRFINESKAVSLLSHKNIVSIHDVAINDTLKYIVMEYIDGITLKDYINKKGILNWKEAVHYSIQILEALEHAHSKNVIHRDVKPQNVMLLKDGTIKVTDFGIAKITTNESITMTDKAIGTVNYISPEQASGNTVTWVSDIYSVGVMLYEMISGTLPFVSDSPVAVATMHVSSKPVPPREKNPHIPVGLEQIILKSMSKRPEDRFSSAQAMIKALKYIVENPTTIFQTKSDSSKSSAKGNSANTNAKKKKKSVSMLPIVSGVTLVFFVALMIIGIRVYHTVNNRSGAEYTSFENEGEGKLISFLDKFFLGEHGAGEEITIPDFVSKTYNEEFLTSLVDSHFKISEVSYVTDKTSPSYTIITQDPAPGSKRKLGSSSYISVSLTVSKPSEPVKMPDLSMSTYSIAKTNLINLGFSASNIVKEEIFHDDIIEGYVVKTSPSAGNTIEDPEEVKVSIYVSIGQELKEVVVPKFAGLKLDEAKRLVIESGLSLGQVKYISSYFDEGIVVSTNVVEGETVKEKVTIVDFYVSKGDLKNADTPVIVIPDNIEDIVSDSDGNSGADISNGTDFDSGFALDENGNLVFGE